MSRRIVLFIATNLATVLGLSLLLRVLGVGNWLSARGIDYPALLGFSLVWGFGGAFISLAISRFVAKMAMRVQTLDPAGDSRFPGLVEEVHDLARQAGLPAMPEVGVYESPELNAFATGPTRSRALVAVSTGLLRRLDRDQVRGVLAHEVAHVANGDMVTMTLLQGVLNAFALFFARVVGHALAQTVSEDNRNMVRFAATFALEIALGLAGSVAVAAFSRRREYRADAGGARLAGKLPMIRALQGLMADAGRQAAAEPAPAGLAAFKISGKPGGLMAWLSTHPPLPARIAALQAS